MSYDVISTDPAVQAHYELCRSKGTSHNLAMIFATRRAPGSLSDREFFAGRGTLSDQFRGDERTLDLLVAEAKNKGYSPSPNDVYVSALANDFGDPLAFVPAAGGRGHVKKVCEMRGHGCEGLVSVKPSGMIDPPQNGPRLAEDIVADGVAAEIRKNPDLASRREEVREAFIERHAPPE